MNKSRSHHAQVRLVSPDRHINIIRIGVSRWDWDDLYHLLITLSWPKFFGLITLLFILTNTLFAIAYLAGGDCIQNAEPGAFKDVFFFSVQTMATIGYGTMSPNTLYANGIVAIEALVGLLGVAMITGLAFSRFARPTAKVLFSRIAVIAPYNGIPTLIFRVANQRYNQILEAEIAVTLARDEITAENQSMRRFYDLNLIRRKSPIFALSWTVMHPIDDSSPLYGFTTEELAQEQVELLVTLTGLDETVSQVIHARHSFIASEILSNMRFVDIISVLPDGRRCVNYHVFHDVIPL